MSHLRRWQGFALAGFVTTLLCTAPSYAETYDVETLVQKARTSNPDLTIAQFDKAAAEGDVRTASAIANPSVRLEWLHIQETDIDRMGFGIGLSWAPPRAGVWSAEKDETKARSASVTADLRVKAATVEASVRALCATVESLREQQRLAQASVDTRTTLVQTLEKRVEQGASTRLDLNMARLSITKAARERDALGVERERTLRQLGQLAGIPPRETFDVAPSANEGAEALPSDASKADPRWFAGDRARVDEKTYALSKERAKRWPWFQFASLPRFRVNDQSSYRLDFQIAIELMLPIFDQNGGRTDKARAALEREQAVHRAHVNAVDSALEAARAEATRQRAALTYLETSVQPLVKEHHALVEAALKTGQLDLVSLLASEDATLRAERDMSEAKLAYRLAKIAVLRAEGAFLRTPSSR